MLKIAYDKVHPRIGITAKWIWGIYAGMTGTLIVLLVFGGMSVFDSICHAFTTPSTGGFSTKQASIEYYHSPYIDSVSYKHLDVYKRQVYDGSG